VQAKLLGRYNGQPNQKVNAVSVDVPAPTLTVKDRLCLVSPKFIVNEYSGGGQRSSVDEACPAILTQPKQKVVSCSFLMNPQYFNAGGSVDNPCFTLIARMDKMPPYLISAKAGQIAIEVYNDDSEPVRRVKGFMALYGIIDIKMRMLKISELKRIMGFPEDYTLLGTQAEQKKFIGNAVEVNMARVLCESLLINKRYE
jgi:DNA (cytosine-5)-methyltransferase 1